MKYNKLVPNANLSKEWEGYMKSWVLRKKCKVKKPKPARVSVQTVSKLPDLKRIDSFSLQEIKIAAQKHTSSPSYLLKDKLNLSS